MADLSPSLTKPKNRENLTTRRIRVFAQRYGADALFLAYHAAFPLTLTSDLLYCLRENFLPDCPWYAAPDVLLSGLCQPIGYDLYEMEGKTRDALLRRLCDEFGEQRLKELANFMSQYVASRLLVEDNDRALVFGERSNWTALAYISPDAQDLINTIKKELQSLTTFADAQERIRWGMLVENYADLLSEKGFQPLLLEWAQQVFDGTLIQDEEEKNITAALGVELQPFEYDVAVITDDEPEEQLKPFQLETVEVDIRGEIIKREQKEAFYFTEYLGETPGKPAALGIEMVAIPGGSFIMGAPKNELERRNAESPQHQVTVQPFFIGKYPITQAQWRFVAQLTRVNRPLKPDPSNFKGDNRPVEQVSWYDAVEFCLRLSQYTGRTYTLPSEAEWEYACRAGTATPFHFGETITAELANHNGDATYRNAPKGEYRRKTTPVGSFGVANAFGLYDMHGNVWEWCLDDWHDNYEGAPTDGSPWFQKNNDNIYQKQEAAVMRGGSWYDHPGNSRSASRDGNLRAGRHLTNLNIGFRVVCGVGRSLDCESR
ncbi:MAG: formylglycine-generating enzyme family protein [Calothrix sp. FI2-JRJ7]|jgi:formylglycine-generating enzyme required for sulfatase activity|nr:formylglycine-generating enzyme family protein [Calothrix sp. FI2-JRJ7]